MRKKIANYFNNLDMRIYYILLFALSAIFLLIYSWSTSPLFANEGSDSAVFKVVGMGLVEGKIPYKDLFDHKGALLYFIDYLGFKISFSRIGIFVLQIISLFATFVFLFKTAHLFVNASKSLFVVLLCMIYLSATFGEGNLTEEWSLPFLSISLYFTIKYILKNNFHVNFYLGSFVCGVCFGLVFMLRLNNVAVTISAYTSVLIFLLCNKQFKQTFINIFMAFLGFALVVLPFVFYYYSHNALNDMIGGSLLFNLKYSAEKSGFIFISEKKIILMLYAFATCIIYGFYDKKNNIVLFLLILCTVLSFFAIGAREYTRYFIVSVPFFCLCIALLLSIYDKKIILAFCLIFVLPFAELGAKATLYRGHHFADRQNEKSRICEYAKLLNNVPPSEKNSIWNYNIHPNFFASVKIIPCNKILCYWFFDIDKKLKTAETLKTHTPQWIIVDNKCNFKDDFDIIENHYNLCATTDTTLCNISLYKLKQ